MKKQQSIVRVVKTKFFVAAENRVSFERAIKMMNFSTLSKKYALSFAVDTIGCVMRGGTKVGFELTIKKLSAMETFLMVGVEGFNQRITEKLMADLEKKVIKMAKPAELVILDTPKSSA